MDDDPSIVNRKGFQAILDTRACINSCRQRHVAAPHHQI